MKVKCIELNEDFLTKDKVYEATKSVMFGINIYWVVADDGCERTFPRSYFEIVKENEEMKELTEREVYANIKEGEHWECTDKNCEVSDIVLHNGELAILRRLNISGDKIPSILDKTTFRLKRQEYSLRGF